MSLFNLGLFGSTDVNHTASSGSVTGVKLINCAIDGDVSVTFQDSATSVTISLVEGDQFAFPFGVTIDFTGTAGTFHVAAN